MFKIDLLLYVWFRGFLIHCEICLYLFPWANPELPFLVRDDLMGFYHLLDLLPPNSVDDLESAMGHEIVMNTKSWNFNLSAQTSK